MVTWLSTGLPELDKMIHGLHNERLYIIGAEAKVGKSLLSNQIALYNANNNIPVGIVSMEMSAREIIKRYAGISQWAAPQEKMQSLEAFKTEAKGKPIYFRQGGASTRHTLFYSPTSCYGEKVQVDSFGLSAIDTAYANGTKTQLMKSIRCFLN